MSVFNMKASDGGGEFTIAPSGSHPAVLVAMVDLGTHEEEYQGKSKKTRKICLAWELIGEKDDKGLPLLISKEFSLSFNKKSKLRELVEKWRGKAFTEGEDFDISKILGKPCLLSVVHQTSTNGKTYAKVDGAMSLPKGMIVGASDRQPYAYEIDGKGVLPSVDWLPYLYGEPLENKITSSHEWKNAGASPPAANGNGKANGKAAAADFPDVPAGALTVNECPF